MIVKIWNQWYGIRERRHTRTVAMIFAKMTKNLINHAHRFTLIMIKPHHSRKSTTTSRITDQCISRQQWYINDILEEYWNIFQDSKRVPLHFQVKHFIELVLGSSLPNISVYKRSIVENEEIHIQI